MKAINFLKWMVNNNVGTESMGFETITDDFDFKAHFGYLPLWYVEPGEYLYLYTDAISSADLESLKALYFNPEDVSMPNIIGTDNEDRRNGGLVAILLFKLEG